MTLSPRYNLWAVLWSFTILILCLVPGDEIPRLAFLDWLKPDKIVHLIMFGILSFFLIGFFQQQTTYPVLYNHAKIYAVIISSFYGAFVEFLQHAIVTLHRSGGVFDALANAIGALCGLWLFNFLLKRNIIARIR